MRGVRTFKTPRSYVPDATRQLLRATARVDPSLRRVLRPAARNLGPKRRRLRPALPLTARRTVALVALPRLRSARHIGALHTSSVHLQAGQGSQELLQSIRGQNLALRRGYVGSQVAQAPARRPGSSIDSVRLRGRRAGRPSHEPARSRYTRTQVRRTRGFAGST